MLRAIDMKAKLASLLFILMMISGVLLPISIGTMFSYDRIASSSQVQFSTASEQKTWYHDCSNLSGFTDPVADILSVGSIVSSGEYIYAEGIGTGEEWHGSASSYPLAEPFNVSKLTKFEVLVEFDSSSDSQLGAMNVILHDSNENVICNLIISDSWVANDDIKMPFTWYYLDGSHFSVPSSHPDWVTSTPYNNFLTLTSSSNGFSVNLPGIGTFDFPVSTDEELNRSVSYVTIRFLRYGSYTYCEDVFIHSINLEWTSPLTIDHPNDIIYSVGTIGHNIVWAPFSSDPAAFDLHLEGSLIDSGVWDGLPITVNVDGLTAGTYEYKLTVYDGDSNSVSDTVFVFVTTATTTGEGEGNIMTIAISIGSIGVIIIVIGAIFKNKGVGSESTASGGTGYNW